uniref:Uncharacterized protein n=1 Tax=Rhizophora mucronata TaxID=61149 RepID=A0A2P2N7H7_RHIMU
MTIVIEPNSDSQFH